MFQADFYNPEMDTAARLPLDQSGKACFFYRGWTKGHRTGIRIDP